MSNLLKSLFAGAAIFGLNSLEGYSQTNMLKNSNYSLKIYNILMLKADTQIASTIVTNVEGSDYHILASNEGTNKLLQLESIKNGRVERSYVDVGVDGRLDYISIPTNRTYKLNMDGTKEESFSLALGNNPEEDKLYFVKSLAIWKRMARPSSCVMIKK